MGGGNVGGGPLVGQMRDRRNGGFVISAMEDVVELRDGIATFDAYWHYARKRILHMIVPVSRKFVDYRCCEGPSTDLAGCNPRNPGSQAGRRLSAHMLVI